MNKNLKSFLYTLFFLYILYLCIKGLVKLFWKPKNQDELMSKTKFVFILFLLFSFCFILIVYHLFEYEQVNRIYEGYLYSVFILLIVGILNNEIFNFGFKNSNDKKLDINELFDYYNKSKK